MGAGLADHVRERLEGEGKIAVEAGAVRWPDFVPTLTGSSVKYGEIVREKLLAAGTKGAAPADMAPGVPQEEAGEIAEFFVRDGTAVRVGAGRYYDSGALAEAVRAVVATCGEKGEVSPGDLREALGLSRKYLIPLLEWLDGRGITVRVGDLRRLGPNAHQSL